MPAMGVDAVGRDSASQGEDLPKNQRDLAAVAVAMTGRGRDAVAVGPAMRS